MKDLDRLKEIMSQAAQIHPPVNFTEQVLARLEKEESLSWFKRVLLEPHYVSLDMNAILSGRLFPQGHVYLILLTGLFYLVTGLVLAIGQKWMPYMHLNEWVRNQALMAFFSTGFFLLTWNNLKREKISVNFLRFSAIVYISTLIMNFMLTSSIFAWPVSFVFSFFLMGLGLLSSGLLIFSSAVIRKECELSGVSGT